MVQRALRLTSVHASARDSLGPRLESERAFVTRVCGAKAFSCWGVVYTPETLLRVLLRQFVLLCCAAPLLTTWVHAQSANETPQPAIFSLDQQRQPVISLVGLWQFKPGDDQRFAEAAYDDSTWALLRSDESWTRQGYETLTGFAWYRFRIVLPAGASHQSLLLPTLSSGYQCFLDGKLVHTEGAVKQRVRRGTRCPR